MDGSSFAIQEMFLRLVGFHRADSIKFPRAVRAFHFLGMLGVFFCFASESFYIVRNFHDIVGSAEAFAPLSTEIITLVKFFTFYRSQDKFSQIFSQIKEMAKTASWCGIEEIKRVNQLDRTLAKIYFFFAVFLSFAYCAQHLVSSFAMSYFFGNEFTRALPFKSAFPYDETSSPAYEISYFMMIVGTYVTACLLESINLLIEI